MLGLFRHFALGRQPSVFPGRHDVNLAKSGLIRSWVCHKQRRGLDGRFQMSRLADSGEVTNEDP